MVLKFWKFLKLKSAKFASSFRLLTDPSIFVTSYNESRGIWIIGSGRANNNGIKSFSLIPKYLVVPGNIDGHEIKSLSYGCFRKNSVIKEITLPETLIEIPDTSIADLLALEKITIPSSVESIDSYFCDFPLLTKVLFRDHSKLKNIGQTFLYMCPLLREIIIPNSVTNIDPQGFLYKSNSVQRIFYFGLTDFSNLTSLLENYPSNSKVYVSISYPSNYFGAKQVTNVFSYFVVTRCVNPHYLFMSLSNAHLYVFILM